ncbi:heterogeneous nuclear ribonucleoprotein Q-like isoform X1 [Daphnia pulicaria]|uniref:heterogeneous nuclear ribonucleoprotein Q-like isoform X1 n=1 Tax=Daphnia pulicaria TaxID=35523 RepID=UPI001EEB7295|nr:heterogeneous nuclear ribonucleoprotein Q-like isoform X1 [Daphnia pulicaria]XP_046645743.1 heterogeneous nuclear ribonucleoprotein Q-like isoform X1 [Daphnia pulicaria]
MADGGEEAAARVSSPEHLEEYHRLIELGLDRRVAGKLEEIYRTGKLVHSELDDRALDALKEFPVDGAQSVLQQFLESNLEHVSNKSAFLCGIMKTYRQKVRALGSATASAGLGTASGTSAVDTSFDLKPLGKGPDEEKIKAILDRTGYKLDVTTGQRKYGGPPPNWADPPPPNGCEVFCGKIPRDVYEDELIPLFEKCGTIWDLRLMMDPLTNLNRGYAFVTFTTTEAAQEAVNQLNGCEIRKGRKVGVTISHNNHRLFVGNIPKNRDGHQLYQDFDKFAPGLAEVIIYSSPDDRRKNRGFCFLEYDSHKSASLAKRRLSTGRVKIFGCDIIVDWADPQEEPDNDTMSRVKVLYVRNLTQEFTEEKLKEAFEAHGPIQRVKKIKDYAFVHFEERDDAVQAMEALNGHTLYGANLEVSLAKPPSDRKKKEEILKARERRLLQQQFVQRGGPGSGLVPVVPPALRGARPPIRAGGGSVPSQAAAASGALAYGRDFDFEYGYGAYRGPYPDPYYNGYFPYTGGDYYYDYPARGGRGRPAAGAPRGGRGRGGGHRGAGSGGSEQRTSSPAGGTSSRWRGSSAGGSGGGSEGATAIYSRGGGGSRGGWRGARGGTSSGRPHPRSGQPKNSAREEGPGGGDGSRQMDESSRGFGAGALNSRAGAGGGDDSVAMGTWRADAQQGGASGAEDAVWYQESYGTQWS